jgi:hypothetical protein
VFELNLVLEQHSGVKIITKVKKANIFIFNPEGLPAGLPACGWQAGVEYFSSISEMESILPNP